MFSFHNYDPVHAITPWQTFIALSFGDEFLGLSNQSVLSLRTIRKLQVSTGVLKAVCEMFMMTNILLIAV